MTYNDYMIMPIADLYHTIFDEFGQVKPCGRDACQALIERLEDAYGTKGEFGDAKTGKLFVPVARAVTKGLI